MSNYWSIGSLHNTDQYLHFSSHHPLQHKLSMIRTLLDRSTNIVTEEQDRKQEEHHIQTALTHCGYPDWSISKVKSQMATSKHKKVTRKLTRQHPDGNKTTVVLPYVQDLSEAVTRVYNRYGIPTSMRPFKSLRSLLVHPKDNSTDRKISANASTRYHVGIVTKPILGRQAEHLEQVSSHRSRHHSQPYHRLGPGQGRRQRK